MLCAIYLLVGFSFCIYYIIRRPRYFGPGRTFTEGKICEFCMFICVYLFTEPAVFIIPLYNMCLVFIKCNYEKFEGVATSFLLHCDDNNCDGNCLEHQGVSKTLQKTPRAHLLPNLKARHSYKLGVTFQTYELIEYFKTSGES